MDSTVQRLLNDKLYDKRKQGALESVSRLCVRSLLANVKVCRLEAIIRESIANGDHERIAKIVDQLCHDYAYAVHQPNARNGGLIGLAAASIALGSVRTGQYSLQSVKV